MLTANDIQAMCTKHGHKLHFGGLGRNDRACPRKTLAIEAGIPYNMYHPNAIAAVADRFGLSEFDQDALEIGFEHFTVTEVINEVKDNYYYSVGQELREVVLKERA